MRSVLVSVRELARSVAFYSEVLGLRVAGKESEVVVLQGEDRTFVVMLRQVSGEGVRHGQQEVGLRAITIDVASQTELDAVATRLEAAGALVSRSLLHQSEPFEVVTGRDPDGLSLTFITYESAHPLDAEHLRHVALRMYGVDL